MNKKTIVAGLSTVALLSSGVVAHADTKGTTGTTADTTTTSTNTQSQTVTKEQVDTAKSNLDQAQSDVDTAQTQADNTQTAQNNAQTNANQAQANTNQAQAVADQATPKNIANAQTKVTNADNNVTTANKTVSDTTASQTQAGTNVSNQQSVVANHQQTVNSAQSDVNSAQSDVNSAQANLDGTGASAIIAKAEQTQAQQDADQKVVDTAQANLTKAQQADSQRQATIDADNAKITTATNDLATKTSDLSKATSKATTAQNNLTTATTNYTVAQNDYNGINTISLTSDYVKYLKQYYNSSYDSTAYNEAVQQLKAINDSVEALNNYKANNNDSTTLVDTNNLTDAQRKELTYFAQDLINQIRTQFGTPKTVATQGAIDFADKVTDRYVADDWSWNDVKTTGHDNKAVNSEAKAENLLYDTTNTGQYYENMYSTGGQSTQISMASAKSMIYSSILGFMFNGYEWAHAQSIAGLMSNGKTDYIGVDVSARTDVTGVHVEMINQNYIKSGSTFDTNPLVNPKTAQAITDTYNKAKSNLATATTANQTAQNNLTNATNAYNTAKTTLANDQAKLAKDTAVALQVPSAQKALDIAKDTLAKSTTENAKAQQAVKDLNADIQTKKQILANAKNVLAQKQAILDSAKANLATEQAKLSALQSDYAKAQQAVKNAQQALINAQKQLATAKENYQTLINAPEKLNEAKQALTDAQTKLVQAISDNKANQDKLEALKAIRDNKKVIYEDLLARYNTQLEAERQAKVETERQAIIAQGGIAVPIFDETGKIVGYVEGNNSAEQAVSTKVSYKPTDFTNTEKEEVSNMSVLPETGHNVTNLSLIIAGIVMFVMGMFGTKGKKEK
ncbi:TPA: SEC10/PgrA surface exclusion domain-containing protein [Streptococcus agalactiae]|nr:SEC10/PgrA surface exclusion domain-containing protein [Streptococcus agalactiae]